MASTIKVNNIQNQCGANIANKCGSTITLGASGDTITLACGASQTGFGRTGTVDWDTTAKTASFTAVSGDGFFCNTTSSAFTATLPAGSAGAIVSFADYAGTWQTNNLTVAPNGTDKIGGVNANVILNTEGQSVTFVYVDDTQGWKNIQDSTSNEKGNAFIVATGGTITTCGNFKIHTFTSPGTFCISSAGSPCNANVDYLIVAGGGGSSNDNASGGGGAGGYRESSGASSGCYTRSPLGACVSALPVTAQGYPVTVGGGGALTAAGSNSVFSTITSAGGATRQASGGSGGGGNGPGGSAGSGNTPPVSPPQGNNGGNGNTASPGWTGGGGGGATAVGTTGPGPNIAGVGGAGGTSCITASPVTRAGGGGGGNYWCGPGGAGGSGGGGTGARRQPAINATAGTANTGGGAGGGGGSPSVGAAGGSGIVIIRYKYQ